MIFYSILFGEPKKNMYVYMFYLLVNTLITTKTFDVNNDIYVVMCTEPIAKQLEQFNIHKLLKVLIVKEPESVYDGMKLKYMFPFLVNVGDHVCVYLDCDLLAIKPCRLYLPNDYICVYAEGVATDSNYCGSSAFIGQTKAERGYTAGCFAFRFGPVVAESFKAMLKSMDETAERFYTLDQPHFNKYLNHNRVVELQKGYLSFNGAGMDKAFMINCCGEPGNDEFHFLKFIQFYVSLKNRG